MLIEFTLKVEVHAEPSITFIDDEDTGIFTVASNTLSVTANGTEWWRISGNGDTHMFSSGALKIPSGTTAARPAELQLPA